MLNSQRNCSFFESARHSQILEEQLDLMRQTMEDWRAKKLNRADRLDVLQMLENESEHVCENRICLSHFNKLLHHEHEDLDHWREIMA